MEVARLFPKLLNATGANPEMAGIASKVAWPRAAGDGLRRHVIPFRLFRKTLVVSVADVIWQKQMQSMSAELISRINKLLGREVIEDIEFRIDPTTVAQVRAQNRPGPRDRVRGPIPDELISAAG